MKGHTVTLLCGLVFIIAACAPAAQQTTPSGTEPQTTPTPSTCTTKDCFIASANACTDLTITVTEAAGTFSYASSNDCLFTKTLVTPNANETQQMKTLLQGKSLTCKYVKGKFDQRWVTSLIYGMEYCKGQLKDVLGQLMAFA